MQPRSRLYQILRRYCASILRSNSPCHRQNSFFSQKRQAPSTSYIWNHYHAWQPQIGFRANTCSLLTCNQFSTMQTCCFHETEGDTLQRNIKHPSWFAHVRPVNGGQRQLLNGLSSALQLIEKKNRKPLISMKLDMTINHKTDVWNPLEDISYPDRAPPNFDI